MQKFNSCTYCVTRSPPPPPFLVGIKCCQEQLFTILAIKTGLLSIITIYFERNTDQGFQQITSETKLSIDVYLMFFHKNSWWIFFASKSTVFFIYHKTQTKVSVIEEDECLTKVFHFFRDNISKFTLSMVIQWLQFLCELNFIRTQAQILAPNPTRCYLNHSQLLRTCCWNRQIAVFGNTYLNGSYLGLFFIL